MFEKIRQRVRSMRTRIWGLILSWVNKNRRFLVSCAVVVAAWWGFIWLVGSNRIDATPALIMVWGSVLVLILAIFPEILSRVKRLKLKDFEIELQETVAKSTTEDFISILDTDEHVFSEKGSLRDLTDIMNQAVRQPSKPILLAVNLKNGRYISIPMLFMYLFFLDPVSSSVTVLFFSSRRRLRDLSDVSKDSLVGATSGKTVLQTFYKRFPHLFRIFEFRQFTDYPIESFFRHRRSREPLDERFFQHCYEHIRESRPNESEFLSEEDVVMWFRGQLSTRTVEVLLSSSDLKAIREALMQGDEFILSLKDKRLKSVISLCYFSKQISKKVLADLVER